MVAVLISWLSAAGGALAAADPALPHAVPPPVASLIVGQSPPASQPLWRRLSPEKRGEAFAALAALVLLGIGTMWLAWWGARATRRYMQGPSSRDDTSRPAISEDDWAMHPLVRKAKSERREKGTAGE